MYLIDLHNYKPPEELSLKREEINIMRLEMAKKSAEFRRNFFNTEDLDETLDLLDFCYKIVLKSGLSDNGTYLPKALNPNFNLMKAKSSIDDAYVEAQQVCCGAVEGLLNRAGLKATDIDILVTTCSIFCPTPSLGSMVVNHFKMRTDIQSYHLGGMGCSNGVVAVNLVKDLLKARPNANALFLTTEITTPAYYRGRDKHRQVTNMIFRMGACAMLMSNKPKMVAKAKYKLVHNVRVHLGSREPAYKCIWYGPDEEGSNGVYLGKDVVKEASRGLTQAMWKIGPKILTPSQIAGYVSTELKRKLFGKDSAAPFKPQFQKCIDNFLIHAGGSKVLDGIGKELQLDETALEPSRAVLHDYGNVSSSTTWYTLGYVESVRGSKKGDKLLQIGVGSGIKCGVNVWQAVKDTWDVQEAWAHRAPASNPLAGRGAARAGMKVLMLALLVVVAAVFFQLAQNNDTLQDGLQEVVRRGQAIMAAAAGK